VTVKLSPPGPVSKLPLGYSNVIKTIRDPLKFFTEVSKYGDVARYTVSGHEVFVISHPDYVRDVLVTHQRNFVKNTSTMWLKHLMGDGLLTTEGEVHLRQRRLAQPAFHKKRIAAYADVMTSYSLRRLEGWRDGQHLDIADEMARLTLEIVAKALFDADVTIDNDSRLGDALHWLQQWSSRALLPVQLAELLERLPVPTTRRFKKAVDYISTTIYAMIKERRESGVDRGDLLSMLVAVRDVEGDNSRMSDTQIHDEIMTFLMAGHETTALAFTWSWYLLSQHPAVEAKLHAELDSVLAGRAPTMEDIPRLRYTENVFTEVMRLYPPAWITSRTLVQDYKMGEYVLPAKTDVILSPYVMHRDPRYFPNPERFEPERWTPEFKAQLPKMAYFPFGGGPHLCIGEPFAWMEGVLVLATIAQHWQMRHVSDHVVRPEPLITLRSKNGMPMILQRREGSPAAAVMLAEEAKV